MRLAIFGGTFDPPHVGHLLAASDALDGLALDRLVFVPNATQPLKGASAGSATQRLDMVRLLAGDDPRFSVDPIEIDRAGLSFTVDTLAHYAERFPDAERYLLIGADVVPSLPLWKESARVQSLARLAVLERVTDAVGDEGVPRPDSDSAGAVAHAPVRLPTRRVDVSSSEIRARVRAGQSIHGFVPDAVARYIAASRLYLDGSGR